MQAFICDRVFVLARPDTGEFPEQLCVSPIHRSAIVCAKGRYHVGLTFTGKLSGYHTWLSPKRLGFEEISSFPKILEIDMGCSGIFPLGEAHFFLFFFVFLTRGRGEGLWRIMVTRGEVQEDTRQSNTDASNK